MGPGQAELDLQRPLQGGRCGLLGRLGTGGRLWAFGVLECSSLERREKKKADERGEKRRETLGAS
jgi:hypothetical protein